MEQHKRSPNTYSNELNRAMAEFLNALFTFLFCGFQVNSISDRFYSI